MNPVSGENQACLLESFSKSPDDAPLSYALLIARRLFTSYLVLGFWALMFAVRQDIYTMNLNV